MNSNNSQKYKSKNDKGILNINYTTAQEYENAGKYRKAIELYNINISKFNHPLSKVKLAELYLSGKAGKIDNQYARQLLEEAYNQGCVYGRYLLAYTLANGIGGKKDETKAYDMFLDEIDEKNPDAMVYLEIVKYMKKNNRSRKNIKSLKKCVTFAETLKYNRKISIDKFNNTKLGRIVNIVPNYVSTKIESMKDFFIDTKESRDLEILYNRANKAYENEDFATARRIFKRISIYGDVDSKIKYAKMCSKGIGGKQDIEAARDIYLEILDKKNRKINRIEKELKEMRELVQDVKKEKNSIRNSKILKEAREEIKYLKNKKTKINMNANYAEAYLQYGLLLVENYKTADELKEGIKILKSFSKNGEYIVNENESLTKYGKQYNRRARIAIKKLGELYEQGKWKPKNIEKTREMFNKFALGKISKYTSYISDKMGGKVTYTRRVEKVKTSKKPKKYKGTYLVASFCELISINSLARKLYTKMCEGGNYQGAYSLATLEYRGKGGKRDLQSAKKHYRDYIRSKWHCEEKEERIFKFYAVNDLATLHVEENDIITAVQLYKLAIHNGNSEAKRNLKKLYKEGKWVPKNESEYQLVKPTLVERIFKKPKLTVNREIKRNISIPNINLKKPVAAAIAAVTSISAFTYNSNILATNSQELQNGIQTTDKNKIYNYVIGDEVGILKNGNLENSTIVGVVAYNSETNTPLVLENGDINYEQFGLTSETYIEKISKEKNINKNSIGLLYCFKKENTIKWVNPLEDDIIVLKKYRDAKKEEEFSEYLV